MNGWSAKEVAIPQAISGIVTDRVVSLVYPITANGAIHHVVKIAASGVAVVGTITAKLQTAIGSDWVDSKTVTVSANGNFYIKLNVEVVADQTFLPLLNSGRIVITTTNAGDAVTIAASSSINVLQEL